ncbi:hypothetical protein Hanom_Chr04g00322681 [Helianthus anomalus]
MDGVNEPNENGKISNLLDPDAKNKPLDESRKTGQTSGTKMTFYSKENKTNLKQLWLTADMKIMRNSVFFPFQALLCLKIQ